MHLFGEDKLRGVAYYRFSAENKQENSIETQREALEKAAALAEVQIIDAFEDDGVTGLIFERPGFQAMLDKYVYAENAPKIDYILISDHSRVSRVQRISKVWRLIGELEDRNIRFGSVERGIPKSEMTVIDTIVLTLDFAMSSEYSRRLSDNVFRGSVKVSEQGYSAGGTAPYGYVRVLLDEQKNHVRILEPGVHKEVSNQRVAFEPSITGEAEVVVRIFHEFVVSGSFPEDIADGLNKDNIPTAKGRKWNSQSIIRILSNETYIGTRVYNKSWGRLREKRRKNPGHEWVRCLNAQEPLVEVDTFHQAQERLYWLRPRMRNRGVRQIRAAQTYVWNFIERAINDFTDDQKLYIRQHLPVVFGAIYSLDDSRRSCFYIPSELQKYSQILTCAVNLSDDSLGLAGIYQLNTKELSNNTYFIATEHEPEISIEQLQNLILELAHEILDHHTPWASSNMINFARGAIESLTSVNHPAGGAAS